MTTEPRDTTEPMVIVEIDDRIATVTLNRPSARNALNRALRRELWRTIETLDAAQDVDVIILTGTDPAFCAGLDLRELAASPPDGERAAAQDTERDSERDSERDTEPAAEQAAAPVRFFPVVDTPIIAAVNGPAITGGFEVALQCSFIIASERAAFADTHARVGILPGAGLTAYLTEAIGVRRALELSLTGNFLSAERADDLGLVNRVVPHHQLLPIARSIATDIASNDRRAVRALVGHYRAMLDDATQQERFEREAALHRGFGGMNNPAERVEGVLERGRTQQRG